MLLEMFKLFILHIQGVIFMIFRFLRYLNDGTYVQIAIRGDGYCTSASRAYHLFIDNATKLSITEVISFLFALLGVLGISSLTVMCAYFATLYLPYYQDRIESPLIICFMSGVIAFLTSGVYLSMIDITATSVLQCYLFD